MRLLTSTEAQVQKGYCRCKLDTRQCSAICITGRQSPHRFYKSSTQFAQARLTYAALLDADTRRVTPSSGALPLVVPLVAPCHLRKCTRTGGVDHVAGLVSSFTHFKSCAKYITGNSQIEMNMRHRCGGRFIPISCVVPLLPCQTECPRREDVAPSHLLSRTGQSAGPRSRHPSIPRATGDALPPYHLVVNKESSPCPLVPILRHYAHCRASSSFARMSRLSATSRGLP